MSTDNGPESDVDEVLGSEPAKCAPGGRFLDHCRIDLPPDDVVENIEFERFFRINVAFGALRDQQSDDDSSDAVILDPNPDATEGDAAAAGFDVNNLPVALYMPFTQQWRLDGYSRGRVVNSFSLGPGEEQTVEVFTWDRQTSALESSTSFDSEQTTESSSTRRDTADVSRDISRQAGLELTSDGKVGFKVGIVDVNASAGMTARAGVNEAEKSTRSLIVDATARATGKVRTSRTLKVTETREAGREERVTRKLLNPNQCHTLTVPFFEVLANYCVSTFVRATEVRLVLLIPSSELSQLPSFDRDAVRVHETSLTLALVDRALAPGFDAARLLDARDRACGILCHGCVCDDDPTDVESAEWTAVVTAARDLATSAATNRSTPVLFPGSLPFMLPPLAVALYQTGLADIRRFVFRKALATHAPRLLVDVGGLGIAPAPALVSVSQVQALAAALAAVPMALLTYDPNVANAAYNDIVGGLMAAMPLVGIPPTPLDPTGYFVAASVVAGRISGDTGRLAQYNDDGLLSRMSAFTAAYSAWQAKQAAERAKDDKLKELARIAKEERDVRILQTFGLRETADAEERLDALLDHLNDPRNKDHYRYAVWNERSGAANDRLMLLALAGVIDPTPVGVVGDYLAVPVRLAHEQRWSDFFAESIVDLVKNTVRDEKRHILPTAAMYAEAIVGECCACEEGIVVQQRHEAEAARLRNELVRLETNRLEGRLDANPPLLDKEYAPPCQVCVPCGPHHDCDDAAEGRAGEPG